MSNTETSSQSSPNTLIKVAIGIILIGLVVSPFIAGYNRGNTMYNNVEASWKNNQNILSQYANKIAENAQIPAQYKKDFQDVIKAEMEGRYGDPATRPNVLANWVQERQLSYDSSLYSSIQQEIINGRNEFARAQTKLVDVRREYTTAVGTFTGFTMTIWGYNRAAIDKFNIVVNEDVLKTFESGIEKPITIFPKN